MSFAIEKEVEGVTYVIEVFSSMYVDWGLAISRKDEDGNLTQVFYSPHALSSESYGFDWEDEDGEPFDEGVEWGEERWKECLESVAYELLEAYVDLDWEKSGENS